MAARQTTPGERVSSRDALAAFPPLSETPTVSVVIPALNEARFIGALLASLDAQEYGGRLEIIVADGGSSDGTPGLVAEAAARARIADIHLVPNPERTTPTGLNHGIAAATGEVIVILGAHSTVDPDFVAANVAALRRTGAAAVGGPLRTRGEGVVGASIAAALSHPFGVGDARFRYANEPGDVDTVAFGAYRREVFALLGGFDPTRDRGEDDHFNYLVRAHGGRLFLDPAIRSTYYARSSWWGLVRQYEGYGRAKGRALAENRAMVRPRHLVPSAAVAAGATLALLGLVSARARLTLALATSVYALLAAFASRGAGERVEGARPLLTALAFPVIHTSYGIGLARGWLAEQRSRRRS